MKRNELVYNCRMGYLYIIDNVKKYKDDEGNIDHLRAIKDFIKDESIMDSVTDYVELMWIIHGLDSTFIKKIRNSVKRSVYAKVCIS